MLFNSYIFLFAYLPLTLAGYQIAARWHRRAVVLWLVLASLVFYAYWSPVYLTLLCASVLFNYLCGTLISGRIPTRIPSRVLLVGAIGVNLAALCFFKYFFPFANFIATTTGSSRHWGSVVLPLGISFFTFTQIAYLVDLQQGNASQQDLGSYALFATFFPHLIAGPILHHAEIMPQFQEDRSYALRLDDVVTGFSWFLLGLSKKVLLADRFALVADPAFSPGATLGMLNAWTGVLSYSLQLYFDFSGYSDMAVGLARMFSIDFPLNFNSPYKAASIIDFWQRWHMTLSRYINTYLYNPLALWVSRRRAEQGKPISRKAMTTVAGFTTMIGLPTIVSLLLAGVWHGAGLQFVVFGLLHAVYLAVNHAWRVFGRERLLVSPTENPILDWMVHAGCVLATFGAVLVAQVFFRANGVESAVTILEEMLGFHGHGVLSSVPTGLSAMGSVVLGFAFVWLLPNTQEIMARVRPNLHLLQTSKRASIFPWQPSLAWGLAMGLILFAVLVKMENPTTFLYFQF